MWYQTKKPQNYDLDLSVPRGNSVAIIPISNNGIVFISNYLSLAYAPKSTQHGPSSGQWQTMLSRLRVNGWQNCPNPCHHYLIPTEVILNLIKMVPIPMMIRTTRRRSVGHIRNLKGVTPLPRTPGMRYVRRCPGLNIIKKNKSRNNN